MMTSDSSFRTALLSVCAALAMSACASGSTDDEMERCNDNPDIHSECGMYNKALEPEWKESATVLPPLPDEENLREIDAFEAKLEYDYLLDRASIVNGSDGVMRYTIVVRSPSGGANVFHEGIRCETNQARTFAYAGSGGKFRKSSSLLWKPLSASGVRGYQKYLANVIMCDRDGWSWDASNAVEALDAQFTADGVRIERACGDLQKCGYYQRHD